jgi:predicted transcriptional regulator
MPAKSRISITIDRNLDQMLSKLAKDLETSKSALFEEAMEKYLQHKLAEDAKALAEITFDDLPTEDEWIQIQS